MPARPRLAIAALVLVLLSNPEAAFAMPLRSDNVPAAPVLSPGVLCLLAFDDANGNGAQDEGEGPVAGVVFTVRNQAHVVTTYNTDGQNEPYCMRLLPGEYRVTEIDAPGRGATGVQSWLVPLGTNTRSDVAYASHAGGGRAPSTDLANTLYGLSGIVFFLAAAAVGGYVVLRGRAK